MKAPLAVSPFRPLGGREKLPQPLPPEPMRRALRHFIAERLPRLREEPIPPQRHAGVTLLMYCFPTPETPPETLDAFEFALRQTWSVLGYLPTVVVAHRASELPASLRALPQITIQEEPALIPGNVSAMSTDCLLRLHTRFETDRVLIVQSDGFPLRDDLDAFLSFDYCGAPNVNPGWRTTLSDALSLTTLNGGFSLRSKRLCKATSRLWRILSLVLPTPPEDRVYSKLRVFFRFPSADVARRFSEDTLEGRLLPVEPCTPMGFHRAQTFAALHAPMPKLTVVSVVRDEACYKRCLRENPVLAGAEFVCLDNTVENRPIPERYNAFLDALPADAEWILFAHEDFQPLADPRPLLRRRNPLFPCGLIGTRVVAGLAILPFGSLTDSDRDGARFHRNAPPLPYDRLLGAVAENSDCCAFFIHADALRSWNLRFDPRCAWDLYIEDFCFNFIRQSGHKIALLPLRAHHFSRGNTNRATFIEALDYLNTKYADDFFAGGSCAFSVGRKPSFRFRIQQKCFHIALTLLSCVRYFKRTPAEASPTSK